MRVEQQTREAAGAELGSPAAEQRAMALPEPLGHSATASDRHAVGGNGVSGIGVWPVSNACC